MNNLLKKWRALWNPNMYHGWGVKKNYFEGWYYKFVDPGENYALALIPGISLAREGDRHAFIQVLDGVSCRAYYYRFATGAFRPSGKTFELHLGNNYFSEREVRLNLPEFKGHIHCKNLHPWPKSLGAPGIMGWYSFVPFMECYHGVVSVDHELEGMITLDDQAVEFTGGRGYTEKDWGTSFPNSWIWMQSNHFGTAQPVSLTASVARIPWLGSHFIGFIAGFLFEGKIHRFATYTGGQMKASLHEGEVDLALRQGSLKLMIRARQGNGGELISPISGQMAGKVNESLQASIEVELHDGEELLFSGTGKNAGLEVAGPAEELLTDKWRS
ncbi:MAG: tocopherol cyclase family protein [Saprospiraceae bacterium]|nr:tocopherol cyclase family protein [Saprospiraceae bacterium]